MGTASRQRIADAFCTESHELLCADPQILGTKDPLELAFEGWPSIVRAGVFPKTGCYERSKSAFGSPRHDEFRRCPLDVLKVLLPHPVEKLMNTNTVREGRKMILSDHGRRFKNAILRVIQAVCQLGVFCDQKVGFEGIDVPSRDFST